MKDRRGNPLWPMCFWLFTILLSFQAHADLWATNGPLSTPTSFHTATLLPNGKVLIAGGNSNGVYLASAELFDPATGTCTNTGSMLAARSRHTATLLTNGKVLVTGGRSGTNAVSDAELYDPSTGAWSITGTPEVPRVGHTATLLSDGTVLVAGGVAIWGGIAVTNSAELYDPSTGTWSEVNSMNTARGGHTATLLPNGQVLVAGGNDSNGNQLSSVEIYDPVSATWTTTNSLNTARVDHTATLLPNGQVLVAGGYSDASPNFLSSAEVFDPTTGIWTTTNSMIIPHELPTATLLPNGNVLIAGGLTSGGSYTNSAELYMTATGTWTNAAFMNFARSAQVATLLPSGKVLVTGGFGTNGTFVAVTETYDSTIDPPTGSWSYTGSMQSARRSFSMTLLPNGKALAVEGFDLSGPNYTNAEIYDPTSETWTNAGTLDMVRWYLTSTLLPNGKVLVAGGLRPFDLLPLNAEIYDPSTGLWAQGASMLSGRYGHTATLLQNGKVLIAGSSGGGDSAEIYDWASDSWTVTGPMISPRYFHQAVLLRNGKVLITGGIDSTNAMVNVFSAELYDPITGTWSAAGTTTAGGSTFWAVLLPNGNVLVNGQDTSLNPAAEVYDPNAGTWMAVQPSSIVLNATATLLPNGKILAVGESLETNYATEQLFDPATGQWMDGGSLNQPREAQQAALLPDGKVLVAGGDYSGTLASAELYDPGLQSSNAWAPQITSVTTPISLGGNLALGGTGFQGISEASGGNTRNSSTAYPLVQLCSLGNQQTTFLPTTNWSANSFTSLPLWNFPPGYALATVFVNGIQSTSSIINVSVPVPTMTTLTGAQIGSNGAFQFGFTNTPGAVLGVLASTNLSLPLSNWTALGGVTELSPGQFQFCDPQATNNPQSFYQLFAP